MVVKLIIEATKVNNQDVMLQVYYTNNQVARYGRYPVKDACKCSGHL